MRCYFITFIKIYVVYIFIYIYISLYIYIYIRARIGICICFSFFVYMYVYRWAWSFTRFDNMFFSTRLHLRLRLWLRTKSYNLSKSFPFRSATREFVHSSIRSNTHNPPPPQPPYGRRVYNIVHVQSTAKMPSGVERSWTVLDTTKLLYLQVPLDFL